MLRGKLVMVGDGFVGSACAYTIMLAGHFSEIVLIDINRDRTDGDALDMAHAAAFDSPRRGIRGRLPRLQKRRHRGNRGGREPKAR